MEENVTRKTFFCVTSVSIVWWGFGGGGTRERTRRSVLGSDLFSVTSPKMKNFRNTQRMRITESCPNYQLVSTVEEEMNQKALCETPSED